MKNFHIFQCFLLVSLLKNCKLEAIVVNITELGSVRGTEMPTLSQRKFYAFRGIPYAEPPINELRFKDPLPKKPWGGKSIDGTREGPTCVQFNFIFDGIVMGQEDCLTLNIYTPKLNSKDPLPVMVWIHGGGFIMGSGSFETDLYGPVYMLDRQIVLVTINYRLEAMGFLSTEDAEAPGNYGLLDQSLALEWVRDHIHHFGGNPNLVTIFGQSAGAASVEFHVLSPRSKGLFHRAIAQSGSAFCNSWTLHTKNGEYAKTLAEYLNCPISPSRDLLECLRKQNATAIANARRNVMIPISLGFFPVMFGPRVDLEREQPFIPGSPEEIVSQRKFNAVPFIAGVTANEGFLFAASLMTADGTINEFSKHPIDCIRYIMGVEKRKDGRELAEKAFNHYFENHQNTENVIHSYEKLSADSMVYWCVDRSVNLFSQYSDRNTYYYSYEHRSKLSFIKLLNATVDKEMDATHGGELFQIFSSQLVPQLNDSEDLEVSEMLLDLWTSFAADGVPQSERIPGGWLPLKEGTTRYLRIGATNPKMIDGEMAFKSRLEFWDHLFDPSMSPA